DQESGLIRDAILTSADVHDSLAGPALVQGDEQAVYADKAYDSQKFRDALAKAKIKDGIMHKARRNKPLKNWQKWFNKAVSPIRSGVKRGFATMKRYYGYQRVRYAKPSKVSCPSWCRRQSGWLRRQGNRVKKSSGDEACQEFVIPGSDFSSEAQGVLSGGLSDQVVGHVLESGDVGRCVVGTDAAIVVAEGHVHDPVEAILDRPVVANDPAHRGCQEDW
ncbi:MAG: transposase, partial [Azospirillum sp.]|nr:transposase [Azospirillum sp.]